jgi:tetraprenyl-beta-curcumene synthase
MKRSRRREVCALTTAGIAYWLTIYPRARREIRRCRRRAHEIPDATLRAAALDKLTRERLNPEAAAFFAVLAPHRHRGLLVRLMVDFQIAYDYLDAINEQPTTAPLRNGLQLHRALTDAVRPQATCVDYYEHHPHANDGGYLAGLVRACQALMMKLPSTSAIETVLVRAAERCGQGQSRNHAVLVEGDTQLVDWTATQPGRGAYLWWELAAGGISCLALHALFAAAACKTGPTPRRFARSARYWTAWSTTPTTPRAPTTASSVTTTPALRRRSASPRSPRKPARFWARSRTTTATR